ncbi:RNA polymerase II transcription mediator complex subunit Srb7, putative [Talaromyces stipitatus ATCC 10500]|uniref:Mediator of RNA polymerase II transcription subunit 21 n=1 Tax=Talaromyces stipitatus (strain ATCC 10500 / CBS 375.48 / QM 6759 / NRRL 1006) TaxID=441959 RepID=B8MRN2_TALSN|nr:RNA polymerase II transcription mediator complex subunit Srb7, putative [Talaromyces stipitatus ATCC 10500]EED13189.1 RNA polymerase II transcription mediator complex subunit Srb7, putative [Talaromyces stipitatus ATCC 10500]
MADILTQLQTCLDQLATQFYATLCYLSTYHDHVPATVPPPSSGITDSMPPLAKIPRNQPSAAPMPAGAAAKQTAEQQGQTSPSLGISGAGGAAGGVGAETSTLPPGTNGATATTSLTPGQGDPNQPPIPDSPQLFLYRQKELARDLIIKEQQIEYLIGRLPGIGSSEAEQEARIRELESELRQVELAREKKAKELKKLGKRLESVLSTVERGIYSKQQRYGQD